EIAADNTLDRYDLGFAHEHRATFEHISLRRELGRHLLYVGAQEVIWYAEHLEPEQRHAGQDLALVGDRRGQDPVEGADAIARDDDELVVKVVHVTDLAAPARDARYVALKQWRHATIVADEFARGLATRAAVAAQRPAKEPAADGEHHNGCA